MRKIIQKLGGAAALILSCCWSASAQNSSPNTSVAGLNAIDAFTYRGKSVSNYGLGWYNDPDNTPPMAYMSGFAGIKFFTWTKPRLFIEGESGRIGINTVTPQALLHLNSPPQTDVSAIRIGDADPGNLQVPAGASTGSYNIDFHTWRDVLPYQIGASIQAKRINVYGNNNALVQGMNLSFLTSDGWEQAHLTERLTIRYDGKVGIGTKSPDALLTVNGGFHARQVLVDLNIPDVPDYVFDRKYPLMPLNDVGHYVRKNHHLPGIPSAADMSKEGLQLGEMNMRLLKKVEELTLYLLEKDKQLRSQSRRISKLERSLNNRSKNSKL